jgi:sugar O-acyltransferase (sialic acid O-acetyltransferase NeuD family)
LKDITISGRTLFIYGAGGHARVVGDVARAAGMWVRAFVDDAPVTGLVDGVPVRRTGEFDFAKEAPFCFIVGIGNNAVRNRLFTEWKDFGEPITLVHPFTAVSPGAAVGHGTVIMPGVVVNAGATIHENVILNTSCSIDHDCVIGPHSHICPGVHIAGSVTVGAGTMIGTGASVVPGIRIGENCTIGAGAVVVRDIPSGSVAYGSPCRVQRASTAKT